MRLPELDCLDFIAVSTYAIDVSADGQPLYSAFNTFAEQSTGLSRDDVLGKTAKEIYPGPGGNAAYLRHLEIIKTGAHMEYEIRLPMKAGIRLFQTTLSPVMNSEAKVLRIIGTSVDITDTNILREAHLLGAGPKTDTEDFITMAAHDLRTPMRNVQQVVEMMREEFEDLGDGKIDLINLLDDISIKAMTLISDVLAHAQATKAKHELATFDFAALCRELYDVLDPMGNHDIALDNGIIKGDKTAFHIVIRNLLDNAFKHGGKDQLKLTIELKELPDGFIQVLVRDDGRGFENPGIAFLETGKMRTDSGFGLLGVRRLVRARGGEISAQSPISGRGSLIKFSLPGECLVRPDTRDALKPVAVE